MCFQSNVCRTSRNIYDHDALLKAGVIVRGNTHMEISPKFLSDHRGDIEGETKKMIRIVCEDIENNNITMKIGISDACTGNSSDSVFQTHLERIMDNFDKKLVIPTIHVNKHLGLTMLFLSPLPWASSTEARQHMATLEL